MEKGHTKPTTTINRTQLGNC